MLPDRYSLTSMVERRDHALSISDEDADHMYFDACRVFFRAMS